MSVDVKYRTTASATGGRDGRAATEDGSLDVKLSTPKELGGAGGEGNNPEQLFAAGYSACFLGAMKAVSGKVGVRVPNDAKVTATAGTTWDDLVREAIASQWAGFAPLSGIPGTVGAAPVQNIGAYGVELSDVLTRVEFLDALPPTPTGKVQRSALRRREA